jgi:hypothetical protein
MSLRQAVAHENLFRILEGEDWRLFTNLQSLNFYIGGLKEHVYKWKR